MRSRELIVLVGLRRAASSVELFRTWHTYAAVGIAAVVIAGLARWS